jgi:hypothetical protein
MSGADTPPRMTTQNLAVELIAFLDANIVLEGKPVAELPWSEVAAEGTIRVLIVPKAMEEIDAKKRDGRLGPIARAFNRLIAPAVIEGRPVVLRESAPRVELQMATCSRIPWDDYDELDPDDGDSRIVAEALHARGVEGRARVLVSHDIKPLAYAKGRNLPVHQASDRWLRDPEPGPKDKEIQRLKQQVAEFRRDEPTLDVSVKVSDAEPLEVYRVASLSPVQTTALEAKLKRDNPMKANGRTDPYGLGSALHSDRDSSYDGKYRNFVSKKIPAFAAAFHEKLELLFNQRLLTVRITNAGQIRADHLVVTVTTSDGWINRKVVYLSPSGPAAPVPTPDYLGNMRLQRDLMRQTVPLRIGRHEFEITRRAARSRDMEATCEDFRSGQEFIFEGTVMPSSNPNPLVVTVSLTASNLRGERTEVTRLEKKIVLVEAADLVDMDTLKPNREYPTEREVERLLASEAYGQIELDGETKG